VLGCVPSLTWKITWRASFWNHLFLSQWRKRIILSYWDLGLLRTNHLNQDLFWDCWRERKPEKGTSSNILTGYNEGRGDHFFLYVFSYRWVLKNSLNWHFQLRTIQRKIYIKYHIESKQDGQHWSIYSYVACPFWLTAFFTVETGLHISSIILFRRVFSIEF